MKALLLNGSPHTEGGVHVTMLRYLEEGLREAGAEVSRQNLYKLDIKPCLGCGTCWSKTPGKCVQKDDMQAIYPKVAASDVIVLATPVYIDRMNSQMKAVIDRLYALLQPIFEVRDDHTRHSRRPNFKPGKVVLVSACGHPERDNFDPLVTHVKAVCRNLDREYVGAVLRPIAWFLPWLEKMGIPVDGVYEAARNAGRQLVLEGAMDPVILEDVGRELVPRETFVQTINGHVQRIVDAIGKD